MRTPSVKSLKLLFPKTKRMNQEDGSIAEKCFDFFLGGGIFDIGRFKICSV